MSDPRYPAGVTAAEHDEAWGTTKEQPMAYCAACQRPISFYQAERNPVVEVGSDTFCNNACRANKVYEACNNATAKAEYKRLVAALSMLAGIQLDRIPTLAKYEANQVIYRHPDISMPKVIELSDIQISVCAMLSQIGDFADETPKWAQDAIDSAEDCAAIIADQVTA